MSSSTPTSDIPLKPLEVSAYRLADENSVVTPSLAVYPALIDENLQRALAWAEGNPDRLRPHVKTHKTAEIIRRQAKLGITKHKAATLAEAELLAREGVRDVIVAYPMVGPNPGRLVQLAQRYADCQFSALVDHPRGIDQLAEACRAAGSRLGVLVDLDAGMGRTGAPLGAGCYPLIARATQASEIDFKGLHLYDGHVEDADVAVRCSRVSEEADKLRSILDETRHHGVAVDHVVVAGTGTFALWLELFRDEPRLEASPGTFVFSDWSYHHRYPDLGMTPAAVLLTRVISKPRSGRLTFDLGHKAVAADPVAADRVHFLNIPDATFVRQNEEHLVVETPVAEQIELGALAYALPYHICPCCALHRDLLVIEQGEVVDRWLVAARDRDILRSS